MKAVSTRTSNFTQTPGLKHTVRYTGWSQTDNSLFHKNTSVLHTNATWCTMQSWQKHANPSSQLYQKSDLPLKREQFTKALVPRVPEKRSGESLVEEKQCGKISVEEKRSGESFVEENRLTVIQGSRNAILGKTMPTSSENLPKVNARLFFYRNFFTSTTNGPPNSNFLETVGEYLKDDGWNKVYKSPAQEFLSDVQYTTLVKGGLLKVFACQVTSQAELAQFLLLHLYFGGKVGSNVIVAGNIFAETEIRKMLKFTRVDMSSLFPEDIFNQFSPAQQKAFRNLDIRDITKFDEAFNMISVNAGLPYKLVLRENKNLEDAEKDANLSGNANPDFAMDLIDTRTGEVIKTYYDCKNIGGDFLEKNHLRPFKTDIGDYTKRALDVQDRILERHLKDKQETLTEEDKAEGEQLRDHLNNSFKKYQESNDEASFVEDYNNSACIHGTWMLRQRIPFNLVVKPALEKLNINLKLFLWYKKVLDQAMTSEQFPFVPIVKKLAANNPKGTQVNDTSHLKQLIKELSNWSPPDPWEPF